MKDAAKKPKHGKLIERARARGRGTEKSFLAIPTATAMSDVAHFCVPFGDYCHELVTCCLTRQSFI